MDRDQAHPLYTALLLVGSATVGTIAGMQIAVRVSTSAWFGALAATLVSLAAVAMIARPVHVQRAAAMREEARRWTAATHEAFLMGCIYGAAVVIVGAALFLNVGTLLAHGHWAAAILCTGGVAALVYVEASELNVLRSLAWRGVGGKRAD